MPGYWGGTIAFATPPTAAVDNGAVLEIQPIPKPSFADPDDDAVYFMMTAKGPGTANVTVTHNDLKVSCIVHVNAYDAAQVEVGKKRYEAPENPSATRKACTSCHNPDTGSTASETPAHDPYDLATSTDIAIAVMATEASRCNEDGTKEPVNELVKFGSHKWNFTQAELDGIVPYVRSLKSPGF